MSDHKKIVLISPFGRKEEALAGGAITPGMLVELNSAGKVIAHNSEGAVHERMFAEEDALQGRTIATAYALNELVQLWLAQPGDEVNAWLKAGENVAKGAILISAGDGTFIASGSEASATTVQQYSAVAQEAVDLSGSGAVNTRIRVRVL